MKEDIEQQKISDLKAYLKELCINSDAKSYWSIFHWFKGEISSDESQVIEGVGAITSVNSDKKRLQEAVTENKELHEKSLKGMSILANKVTQ